MQSIYTSLISCTSQLERWVWKGDVLQWTETAAAWLRLPELFPRRTRTPKVTSPNSQAYHHRLPILTILNNWTMSQPFFWRKTNIYNTICTKLAPVFLTFRMYGMNLPKNIPNKWKKMRIFQMTGNWPAVDRVVSKERDGGERQGTGLVWTDAAKVL